MFLNKVTLLGCLTDRPLIREVGVGLKMVGLSLLTTRYWSDARTGDVQECNELHRVMIINQRLAAYAETHLSMGEHVYVEGELHTERWRDEIFEERSSTEILLWQDSDQLLRFIPGQEPARVISPDDPMLAALREAHRLYAEAADDSPMLEHGP